MTGARRDTAERTAPNDLTAYAIAEGKLYVCVVNDMFSNRIVGCPLAHRMQDNSLLTRSRPQSLDVAMTLLDAC